MEATRERFIPALGLTVLTPLYDSVIRFTTREQTFKKELLRQVEVNSGDRVLDVGCGTGTLALSLKQTHPTSLVSGLDADQAMLMRAERKAKAAQQSIAFDCGSADQLPYASDSFDTVLSSLFFHHLTTGGKRRAFSEIIRCLKPGRYFHLADWGGARGWMERALFFPVRLLDGFTTTADNISGRLPELMSEAGFSDVEETERVTTPLGVIAIYRARKPASDNQGG